MHRGSTLKRKKGVSGRNHCQAPLSVSTLSNIMGRARAKFNRNGRTSVTTAVSRALPYQRAASTRNSRMTGRHLQATKRALARGTRKHAAIAKLVGQTRCPPKCPKYVQRVWAALAERGLKLLAAEVAFHTPGLSGIIDLVAVPVRSTGPPGRATVIEVKTIHTTRAAWEAELAKRPHGRRAVDARRARAQVLTYARTGPYVNPDALLLYVFQDAVLLCRSS